MWVAVVMFSQSLGKYLGVVTFYVNALVLGCNIRFAKRNSPGSRFSQQQSYNMLKAVLLKAFRSDLNVPVYLSARDIFLQVHVWISYSHCDQEGEIWK